MATDRSNDREDAPKRSNSRCRTSRPTTPLRPSSRSSFRDSARATAGGDAPFPLNTFEPAFAELSDAMADLEANLMHFQLMHESLARFTESFASFLFGLNVNAFCVDFPEGPIPESFRRARQQEPRPGSAKSQDRHGGDVDGETTFMTTDTSFVENPVSSKTGSKFATPDPKASQVPAVMGATRGGGRRETSRGGRTGGRGTRRGSGLARPRGRGIRSGMSS